MSDLSSGIGAELAGAREAPTLFELSGPRYGRGLVAVTGADAPRWLDGMVTNDIPAISSGNDPNGCYAALLTPKGRIVADLNVLAREDGYWLETAVFAVGDAIARLDKYIVADDVELADRSAELARTALEGPGSRGLLEQVAAVDLAAVPEHGWRTGRIAGAEVTLVRTGFTGGDAWQLLAPAEASAGVSDALRDAGAGAASLDALDVLRIEAGVPLLGPELDEEVFPDEARLESAISRTKGCYTGQEIVARLYSRGAVNHLLVGLRFQGEAPPPAGTELFAGGKRTGEVTSSCVSPVAGAIGIGYVRRDQAEARETVRWQGDDDAGDAAVVDLPIVPSRRDPARHDPARHDPA